MMNILNSPDMSRLLNKWKPVLDSTRHIRTFTTDSELAWLAEYSTWCSCVLETGSWRGRSAKVMLMANPGLRLMSLDSWDDSGTFEEYQHNLGPEISAGRVQWRRGPSQAPRDAEEWYGHYDGCFIDGGHEEHLVKADVLNTACAMKKGSVMVGHDYRSYGGPNDVARGVLSIGHAVLRPCDSLWAIQL